MLDLREHPILVPKYSKRESNPIITRYLCPLHAIPSISYGTDNPAINFAAGQVVLQQLDEPEHSSIKLPPRFSFHLLLFRWSLCRSECRDKWLLNLSKRRPPELDSAFLRSLRHRFRCALSSQREHHRSRPFRNRRSVHAVPNLLGRLGWTRWDLLDRTARQVCSDLRGGSCPTNQYTVQINVLANVTATNETVTGAKMWGSNLLRDTWRGRS